MKIDLSKVLYDKYIKLPDSSVTIILINGEIINGIILSYFKGNTNKGENYIVKWHIVDQKDKMSFGIDAFGFLKGIIINTNEIASVLFTEDNSKIEF
ncbi:MAG: hypothetical protein V4667_06060 [Bacteroidota bacterium]